MENKLNIYQKLQGARVKMQEDFVLKKDAQNTFSKYSYFTLGSLLPAFNKVLNDQGLYSHFDIDEHIGNLLIVDVDDPDQRVVFSMPSMNVELKGSNALQSSSARNTYLMRYLLMTAMQVSESSDDIIDSTEQSELNAKDKPKSDKPKATGKETIDSVKAEVVAMCKELQENGKKDITQETVKKYHVTPNPTGIKDLGKLQQLREDLKKL